MAEVAPTPLHEIDLADPGLYCEGDPHAAWRTLRSQAPVFWNREVDGPGFWALTKYEDAVRVYRDPLGFSSARGIVLNAHRWKADPAAGKMLALTDPPRHAQLRQLLKKGFTPRTVLRLEANLRAVVAQLIEEAVAAPPCDFVTMIAAKLPVSVICDLMGVPPQDRDLMFELTRRAFGADDPEYQTTPSGRATAAEAHNEILLYYADLASERRQQPRDDIVTILATARVDGVPLTDQEVLLNCDNLIVGGNETARHAAAGGLLAFIQFPDEWTRLKSDASLVESAVEEVLRWTSPGMHVLRTATRDVQIRDRIIREGQSVTIWNPSANRDEEAFPNPDQFDIRRRPNRHLALGAGEHFCLGASLARLELRVLLEELTQRVNAVELAGTVQRLRSNLIGGIKHLPVVLTGDA